MSPVILIVLLLELRYKAASDELRVMLASMVAVSSPLIVRPQFTAVESLEHDTSSADAEKLRPRKKTRR
jgi:hypothetical protein